MNSKFDHKELERRLKEDELAVFLQDFKKNARTFYENHGRQLITTILVVVIVIAGYNFMKMKSASDFESTQGLYANAVNLIQQENYTDALTQLSELVSNFSGTPIAALAHVQKGNCFFQTNDFANAKSEYQTALNSLSGADALPVHVALIQTERSLGNPDQALIAIDKLSALAKTKESKEEASFIKGNCYEDKSDTAKALEAYKSIPSDSVWYLLAYQRIQWLEAEAVAPLNP